jgi:hypothetical protein
MLEDLSSISVVIICRNPKDKARVTLSIVAPKDGICDEI